MATETFIKTQLTVLYSATWSGVDGAEATNFINTVSLDGLANTSLTVGTGTGKADAAPSYQQQSIANAGTFDINLKSLPVRGGTTLVADGEVREIVIATNYQLQIGNTLATQFLGFLGAATHTVNAEANQLFIWKNPVGVAFTAANNLLRLTNNSGSTATVDIYVQTAST